MDINVTPMIDVMLVLLIIFMIVTPAIDHHALLPRAAHGQSSPDVAGEVRLGIDRAGRFFLDVTGADGKYTGMRFVADGDLAARLGTLYAGRGDRIMFLKADANVPYARVQDAIQVARHAGVRVIGAIVEQRREMTKLATQE